MDRSQSAHTITPRAAICEFSQICLAISREFSVSVKASETNILQILKIIGFLIVKHDGMDSALRPVHEEIESSRLEAALMDEVRIIHSFSTQ